MKTRLYKAIYNYMQGHASIDDALEICGQCGRQVDYVNAPEYLEDAIIASSLHKMGIGLWNGDYLNRCWLGYGACTLHEDGYCGCVDDPTSTCCAYAPNGATEIAPWQKWEV